MTDDSDAEEPAADTPPEERPEPTMPVDLSVSVSGFTEEDATRLGHAILGAVREISRYVDLEKLDGITVATDYPSALAALDRGGGHAEDRVGGPGTFQNLLDEPCARGRLSCRHVSDASVHTTK